ncbi:hypothetical protein [Streptomyces sp. NPDC046909]|uniref:hypothetical protein n=1 Tax=Streptomyces sp. NPDC046909 TaxID=3155617 RepID=UPI0033E30F7A
MGTNLVGESTSVASPGVWGFFKDSKDVDRPQRSANFVYQVAAGVWGTTANEGEVPADPVLGLRTAAGVVGQVSLPGRGFGYGVLGLGHNDEGVVGWSEKGAGGKFQGNGPKGPGIIAQSEENCGGQFESKTRGQIRLVDRQAEFGTTGEGVPYPKLPSYAKSGEMITVNDGVLTECSLWLCVKSSRPKIGIVPAAPAQWAQVQLSPSINGET